MKSVNGFTKVILTHKFYLQLPLFLIILHTSFFLGYYLLTLTNDEQKHHSILFNYPVL